MGTMVAKDADEQEPHFAQGSENRIGSSCRAPLFENLYDKIAVPIARQGNEQCRGTFPLSRRRSNPMHPPAKPCHRPMFDSF